MLDRRFFSLDPDLTVKDLTPFNVAVSDDNTPINDVVSPSSLNDDCLAFVDGRKMPELSEHGKAIILTKPDWVDGLSGSHLVLASQKPKLSFLQFCLAHITPESMDGQTGLIHEDVKLEEGVIVHPGAVIGKGAAIGHGSKIGANSVIGPGVQIGRDCDIGPNVSIESALLGDGVVILAGARIGQSGFGLEEVDGSLMNIPHYGRAILQDGVYIGATTTIDRGMLDDTIIGEQTKIDNQCQVGHNCVLGRGVVMAAHCGISGSVNVGDFVMMGGKVGIADHVDIGDGAQLAARAGVMASVEAGARVGGMPAIPVREWLREQAWLRKNALKRG